MCHLLAFLTSSLAFAFLLLMGTLCGRRGYFREQMVCSVGWKLYQMSSLNFMYWLKQGHSGTVHPDHNLKFTLQQLQSE